MLTVLGLMTAGIVLGIVLRNRARIVRALDPLISVAIWLLLFLLGIAVGTNETISANLGTLGAQALLLAFGGVMGSVGLAFFTYRFFFRGKK